MHFEFSTVSRIIFGSGTLNELGPIAAEMGTHSLVVTNRKGIHLLKQLKQNGIETTVFKVPSEPTIDLVGEGTQIAREQSCDLIIGIGGGSVIDTGKAISSLLANGGVPLDYLEVIGEGKKITQPSLPFIAIPTTSGTGAEVTRNAVLLSPKHHVKVSMRSPYMLARLALIDPELTYTLPPSITASTGLDALTQVLEPYVSIKANPLTDTLCREGMKRAARSLRKAYEHGDNAAAREDMSLASLFGGLALANAKLGAVHGFAGPFGGMFQSPHGAVCACLLPHVMEINILALRERLPESPAIRRYDEVAQIITGNPKSNIDDGVKWVKNLTYALQIPSLSSLGIKQKDFPILIEKALLSSSMKGNPIKLTTGELEEILKRAL